MPPDGTNRLALPRVEIRLPSHWRTHDPHPRRRAALRALAKAAGGSLGEALQVNEGGPMPIRPIGVMNVRTASVSEVPCLPASSRSSRRWTSLSRSADRGADLAVRAPVADSQAPSGDEFHVPLQVQLRLACGARPDRGSACYAGVELVPTPRNVDFLAPAVVTA